MRWLILNLMLAVTATSAQADAVKLTSGQFQVHIRPQLVGIYQDFRQILNTFPDYPDEVLQLLTTMDRMRESARALNRVCPGRTQPSCMPALSKLLEHTRDLDRLFMKFQSNIRFGANANLGPVSGQKLWLRLDAVRARLQRVLELEILCLSAGRVGERPATAVMVKLVDEMEAYHDLLVLEFIPPKLADDFRSAWMNFFRPLHRYGEVEGRVKFIETNLSELNFYWNLLNMRMTKRLKKVPEGMAGPLNAIQNRWNQVVRVSYGQ